MSSASVTVTLPASVVSDLPEMSQELVDRMHALLERNADGQLSDLERIQAETLVEMAEFTQVFATAIRGTAS